MRRAALKDMSKLLVGSLAAKAIGLVSLVIFTRILSKDQLAIFPLFLLLSGLLNYSCSFGVCPVFIRVLPSLFKEDLPQARSLVLTGSLLVFGAVACAAIALWFFAGFFAKLLLHDAGAYWLIRLMGAGGVVYVISFLADYIMWARGQFAAGSILQIVEAVSRTVGAGLGFMAWGTAGIVCGFIVSQIIVALASLYCLRDLLAGGWPKLYPVSRLLRQSIPLYFDNLLWYLRGDGDTLLVTTLLGPAYLATYYVAKILFSNALVLFTSLDRVILHRLALIGADTAVLTEKVSELHVHLTRIAIPALMLTIGATPSLVALLAGPRYEAATFPAAALLLVALAQFLMIPVDRTVLVALPPPVRLGKTLIEVMIALALAFILVPFAGVSGVAGARLAGEAAGGTFGLVCLKSRLGISLSYWAAVRMLLVALPGTALVLAFHLPTDTIIHAALSATLSTAVWLGVSLPLMFVFDRQSFDWGRDLLTSAKYSN